jgi:hypothetical protein
MSVMKKLAYDQKNLISIDSFQQIRDKLEEFKIN